MLETAAAMNDERRKKVNSGVFVVIVEVVSRK
jgi:hypothetical protein